MLDLVSSIEQQET